MLVSINPPGELSQEKGESDTLFLGVDVLTYSDYGRLLLLLNSPFLPVHNIDGFIGFRPELVTADEKSYGSALTAAARIALEKGYDCLLLDSEPVYKGNSLLN